MYDVIVVGAGSAGGYLAYLLSRAGFKVALIEMKPRDRVFKVTGDAIGDHHIERMIIKPPSDVVMMRYEGVELYSPDMSVKYVVLGKGYALEMGAWARWLISEAEGAGAEVLDNHRVQGPLVEDNSVVGVKVLKPNGSLDTLRSRVVVDASGSPAVIRSRLPRDWWISEPLLPVDSSHAFREIIEVDYDIEKPEYIKIYLDALVAPGGYWWLFPKGRRIMNIGLGIWGKLSEENGLNPRHNYEKYILNTHYTRGRRLIHVGGGIVPTRRPLASMVGNGVLAVGDAAVAVNPIHGGGIGPALLSAESASRAIANAFERNDFTMRGLWSYNIDYLREYGIKQAKLDVLRLMLQTLSNDELNKGLRARLLTEDEVLEISQRGSASLTLGMKLRILTKLLTIPRIAWRLRLALNYMDIVGQVYSRYPNSPEGVEGWFSVLSKVYSDYTHRLGLRV